MSTQASISNIENRLYVANVDFKRATKPFRMKKVVLGPALLAFEAGYLSIESGEVTVVMNAQGSWHGRATFALGILRALVSVPPTADPITFAYADGRLLVSTMTIPCKWANTSKAVIKNMLEPSLLDLLALERTLPRVEVRGTELGRAIKSAKDKTERRITNAAKQLADLEISEGQIREMVEARIASRLIDGA